jgi:hypothetical protein
LQFDWLIFLGNYYHVGFKKGREAGLTLEGEVVAFIEFNKHNVDIFINGTWQKYAGNIGRLFKITRLLELRL